MSLNNRTSFDNSCLTPANCVNQYDTHLTRCFLKLETQPLLSRAFLRVSHRAYYLHTVSSVFRKYNVNCGTVLLSKLSIFCPCDVMQWNVIYSCSSEACQNHQKLDSLTLTSGFTTQSTNSIPQIIIKPRNMQLMKRLAFFFLSRILKLALFHF